MTADRPTIDEVVARTDALIRGDRPVADPLAAGDELLAMGEAVLEAWIESRDKDPTDDEVEGFRLLGLHRQGAKGDPSFNACRETCREIVYHRNVIHAETDSALQQRMVRLGAMVVRHLALFVGGKLQEAGLGDFCCSSRPVRQGDGNKNTTGNAAAPV